jgi:ribosomal protein S18 acetylase RimI-like enzyme
MKNIKYQQRIISIMDSFKIRKVKTADLESIYEIHKGKFPKPASPRYYETLKSIKSSPFYVAIDQDSEDEQVIGFIAIRVKRDLIDGVWDSYMSVASIATSVDKEAPFTNEEVEKRLIQRVVDDFDNGGFYGIYAELRESSKTSLKCFEELGFSLKAKGKYKDGEKKIVRYYLEDLSEVSGDVEIKRMNYKNLNRVLQLHNTYLKSSKQIGYYHNLMRNQGAVNLVAVDSKGRVFGYLCARRQLNDSEDANSRRDTLNFTTMVVDDRARGKGIGTALVETMIEQAKEGGIEIIRGDVRETNTGARKLYQKMGFKEKAIGEYKDTGELKYRITKRLRLPPLSSKTKRNLERAIILLFGYVIGRRFD